MRHAAGDGDGASFSAADAAGVLGVRVVSNENAAVTMPFAPFGDATPCSFLSGDFSGDGDVHANRLYRFVFPGSTHTNAVFSAEAGWLDPATGEPSDMTVARSDTLVFAPGSGGGLDFWLFGRVPGLAPYSGLPRIRSMSVSPANGGADIEILSRGRATDILAQDTADGFPADVPWLHLDRIAAGPSPSFVWRDFASPPAGARIYLASDATRDTDGDGLPDALELRVYGTSPYLSDTDGDGTGDAAEIAWGTDPLTAEGNDWTVKETFEPPAVATGTIDAQNGWRATVPEAAIVQTNTVHGGENALEVRFGRTESGENAAASLAVTSSTEVVWVDFYSIATLGCDGILDPAVDGAAISCFDSGGHPVMSDGGLFVTNTAVAIRPGRWVRQTYRLDYANRVWDCYVDGLLVERDLAMRSDQGGIRGLDVAGEGCLDDISFASKRPPGLSSDGDALPDEWELAHFGSLARDGSADFDGDGTTDYEEYLAGTDPVAACTDTDGDSLPDWWELRNGLDPRSAGWTGGVFFSEPFEPPATRDGDIAGQNGWTASGDGTARVQGVSVRSGSAALRMDSGGDAPSCAMRAAHAIGLQAWVLWIDMYQTASAYVFGEESIPEDAKAAHFFDKELHPVATDGGSFVTNLSATVREGGWTRCTYRFDLGTMTWDMYLDGLLVFEGLGLRGASRTFASFELTGSGGCADDIAFSTVRPEGLSSDGDEMPDEWEWRNFGTLERDGSGDSDGDGASDAGEFASGTDPNNPDTDGDGMPDGWEIANGLDPADAADALEDLDGDGYPNILECHNECNPREADEFIAIGYTGGLDVEYYALNGAIASMPDVSNLEPCATGIWDAVDQPAVDSAWKDAPEALVDRFAAVIAGAVYVPSAGRYRFTIASDDGSRLWIDGKLAVDHGSTHSMTSRAATLPLTEGLHDLRIEYFENTGSAGLQLYWSKDAATSGIVPPRFLFRKSGGRTMDADGDGMPDWWEAKHGLDPSDASDAALDADGDGLDNLSEYASGTDPNKPDTDGDGMPDAWEAANGTIPFLSDAVEDPDGDGLVNLDEMRFGTDPFATDTDGDGVGDLFEIRNSRSNPLVSDMACETAADVGGRVQGASASGSTGAWRTDSDGTIYAAERAGSLTWNLEVPSGGADALAVSIGQHDFYSKAATFDLSLYVDGLFVARQVVTAPYGTRADAFFFLPEIPAGEHEFRLVWRNWEVNTFLSIHDLRFVSFGGADADGNGVPDWKDYRAAESSALDELPLESLVSPLCIEGRDLWRDILDVEVEYPDTNAVFSTVKTIGDGFYADIPLPEDGTATISLRDRSLAESFNVTWKALDVFDGEYATNAIVIRTGDALKIAPHDDGESEVSICRASNSGAWAAVTNWTESVSTPYVFETQGMYLVTVSREGLFGSDVGYALVDVVRSRFPKRNPAILLDAEQTLSCPDLSPRNILEHDAELRVDARAAGGGVELSLLTHADRDLGLVSRLADGGAISDAVQVTPMWADNGTYYRVADTYPDGSQLVEVSLLLGAVPEGTSVTLTVFVSGVSFDDGTRTKTLTAADFDEDGHCTVRFIRARGVKTSVCHSTRIYQDGKLIYKNR